MFMMRGAFVIQGSIQLYPFPRTRAEAGDGICCLEVWRDGLLLHAGFLMDLFAFCLGGFVNIPHPSGKRCDEEGKDAKEYQVISSDIHKVRFENDCHLVDKWGFQKLEARDGDSSVWLQR